MSEYKETAFQITVFLLCLACLLLWGMLQHDIYHQCVQVGYSPTYCAAQRLGCIN